MPIDTRSKITPCLWFDTQGDEAATFYTSIFPNSKIVDISRYGDAGPRPAETVMTVLFELDGQRFLALNGGPQFTFSEAVSFQVDCPRAARRGRVAGSRTGSDCRGRSCPRRCRGCCPTRTARSHSASWRRCSE